MMNLKVTESFDGKENKLGKDMTSLEWQAKSFTWQNLDILQEEDISNQEEDEEISTKVGAVTSPDGQTLSVTYSIAKTRTRLKTQHHYHQARSRRH